MPDPFSALADATRREILSILAIGPRSAGDIAHLFPQVRPAISKHLSTLKRAGLVSEARQRQRRVYSLQPSGLAAAHALLARLLSAAPIAAGSSALSNYPRENQATPSLVAPTTPTPAVSTGYPRLMDLGRADGGPPNPVAAERPSRPAAASRDWDVDID